jgi:hypothetical protein
VCGELLEGADVDALGGGEERVEDDAELWPGELAEPFLRPAAGEEMGDGRWDIGDGGLRDEEDQEFGDGGLPGIACGFALEFFLQCEEGFYLAYGGFGAFKVGVAVYLENEGFGGWQVHGWVVDGFMGR